MPNFKGLKSDSYASIYKLFLIYLIETLNCKFIAYSCH